MIHADLRDLYQRRARLAYLIEHGTDADTQRDARLALYASVQQEIARVRGQGPHHPEEPEYVHNPT